MDNNESKIELYKAIISLKNIEDCEDFFEDLCTKREFEQMSQRFYAAELLMEGDTYSEVMEKTNISSATLSRVSRCVQYGSGYNRIIKELGKK